MGEPGSTRGPGSTRSPGPLRSTGFRRYLGARLVSVLGSGFATIALAFAVLDLTGSSADLGLVLAARSVPLVVFLLLGGVFADRLPRHLVMVAANLVSFATQAVAATLVLTGVAQIWQLAVIEAVNGTAVAFIMPAMTGVLPQLVPREQLQQASALGGFARNGGSIAGAALGGIAVAAFGSGWGLAVDAASFAVSAALLVGLRLPAADRAEATSVLRDLRDGWREFASRTWLWVVVLAFGVINAVEAGAWTTLGPVIADETFGRKVWGLAVSAQSAGLLVAMVVLLRYRPRRPLLVGMAGVFGLVPAMAALGLWPHGWPLLLVLALAGGFGIGLFSVTWETSLATHVPLDALSRVSSYDALGSFVALPLGQAAAGWLGAAFPARAVAGLGAVVVAVTVAAGLLSRSVRDLPAAPPAVPER
jgi:MFS family permease